MCTESKGRTIHLLKKNSKPVPQVRPRRKIDLKGTFSQYKQAQEEHKREETEEEAAKSDNILTVPRSFINNDGSANVNPTFPNVIGNVEDMRSVLLSEGEHTRPLEGGDVQMEQPDGNADNNYKDITPSLKRAARNKSKQRL